MRHKNGDVCGWRWCKDCKKYDKARGSAELERLSAERDEALRQAETAVQSAYRHFGLSSSASTPSDALPSEVAATPFVGYRAWGLQRVYPTGAVLTSFYDGATWTPRQRFEGGCVESVPSQQMRYMSTYKPDPFSHCASVPALGHTCGVYALKGDVQIGGDTLYAVGEVYLWGRVIDAEYGYRAQYAYPKKLAVVNGSDKVAGALEFAYGVPCEVWE